MQVLPCRLFVAFCGREENLVISLVDMKFFESVKICASLAVKILESVLYCLSNQFFTHAFCLV